MEITIPARNCSRYIEAILIAKAIHRPPMVISTAEAEARPTPIVIIMATRRPHTGTTLDKVSGRHRAILIRSATRLPSSEAMTITPPFGRGKIATNSTITSLMKNSQFHQTAR